MTEHEEISTTDVTTGHAELSESFQQVAFATRRGVVWAANAPMAACHHEAWSMSQFEYCQSVLMKMTSLRGLPRLGLHQNASSLDRRLQLSVQLYKVRQALLAAGRRKLL